VVAAPDESRTPNWHRAKIAHKRVRMEGWRQRRGWLNGKREKKSRKEQKALDRDGPSHGRTLSELRGTRGRVWPIDPTVSESYSLCGVVARTTDNSLHRWGSLPRSVLPALAIIFCVATTLYARAFICGHTIVGTFPCSHRAIDLWTHRKSGSMADFSSFGAWYACGWRN
jgi:hypothetical protein